MASLGFSPPDPFNFQRPDGWTTWKRRFECFRSASGLSKENEPRQVSAMLYCMGEQSDSVLNSTNISNEDREKYASVMSKFDEYFKVRRNVIFERARFNRRNQLPGETIEQYITVLCMLIETCEYGELKEELLRDRIVVGIRDMALSERLQLESDLSLERAKKIVRQKEAVKDHSQELNSTKRDQTAIDAVKKATRIPHRPSGSANSSSKDSGEKQFCKRCGKDHRPTDKCPAKKATCYKCNHKGHFSAQCLSRRSATATTSELTEDTFLGTLSTTGESSWSISIQLEGKQMCFKLDTGAEVSAISDLAYKTLGNSTLQKPAKVLVGPTRNALKVLGQFDGTFWIGEKTSVETVFVVSGLKSNLLGLPAIKSLQLLQKIYSVSSLQQNIRERFPKVFSGLGTLGDPYTIKLKEGAKPYALYAPRNIPFALRDKVRTELEKMERMGVIKKVTEPSQWCAGVVIVPKSTGAVRICVDLKPLNASVLREPHPIPKVDETLAQLSGATVFSKVDANSGFWQIPLAEESQPYTTFISPFGRYCFRKLPFGISSAPELFQRRISQVLEGLAGVLCHMDDVLIFGATQEEHDQHLTATLQRLETAGVTLNPSKCEFSVDHIKFLGHIINKSGVRADPDKVSAIVEMGAPANVPALRRFLGMVNHLGKFSPRLGEITQPLRELLTSKRSWTWGPDQQSAFSEIKSELSKPTLLSLYNPMIPCKVSADASSFGLGAVLLQFSETHWKPVAYASRSMTETERRYAQIEKEALAVTWACEKFSDYLLGQEFEIETDHKPLIPLLNSKALDNLPPRVLRFRLRLARYQYIAKHVPGKLLFVADTLSRAPISQLNTDRELQNEVSTFMDSVTSHFPATEKRLKEYQQAQSQDPVCLQVITFCQSQWPQKSPANKELVPYWRVRASLSICNNLLLYNDRIVVPSALQANTLQCLHEGHQGIQRCRMRARISVWWPNISKQIEQMIAKCQVCAKDAIYHKEPMMPTPLPEYPWQVIGSDLFEVKGSHYLLIVDYFSRFPEIVKLYSITSTAIISAFKSVFSRFGIQEILRSDNGPQFSSEEMTEFTSSYGIKHNTSSPYFPQSNGMAERFVRTAKQLLKQSSDLNLALLTYRATLLPFCNRSTSELLMGRCIRTKLPQTNKHLIPEWSYLEEFKKCDQDLKKRQKRDYDRHYKVRQLPDIPDNTDVWVTRDDRTSRGQVVSTSEAPRSYNVNVPSGNVRRNRRHLRVIPDSRSPIERPAMTEPTRTIMTRQQTGTEIRPPTRLIL